MNGIELIKAILWPESSTPAHQPFEIGGKYLIRTFDPRTQSRMMIHDAAVYSAPSEFIQHVIDAVNGAYDPATREMIFAALGAEKEK